MLLVFVELFVRYVYIYIYTLRYVAPVVLPSIKRNRCFYKKVKSAMSLKLSTLYMQYLISVPFVLLIMMIGHQ